MWLATSDGQFAREENDSIQLHHPAVGRQARYKNGVPAADFPTGTPFWCVPAHLHPCLRPNFVVMSLGVNLERVC